MINSFNFNPFNHGTSSILYRPVTELFCNQLGEILQSGWNLKDVKDIKEHDVGPKINSNNFKVEVGNKKYLLKISHIKELTRQSLINNCLQFCRENGVSTAKTVLTLRGKSFFEDSNNIYCLYNFIDGDNFDGSRNELISAAKGTAKLITVLEKISLKEKIKINSCYLCHDAIALKTVMKKALKSTSDPKIDKLVRDYHSEIEDSSEKVSEILFRLNKVLPQQVIHGDLHPHNMLFDRKSKQLLAILDFDVLKYSQRIRATAFAMHRLCRTYGPMTEKKNDVNGDIRERIKLFLDAYLHYGFLNKEEIGVISIVLQDEALSYIEKIIRWHYFEGNTEWSFDLEKRIITLLEAKAFF